MLPIIPYAGRKTLLDLVGVNLCQFPALARVHLFVAPVSVTDSTVLTDFTESTNPGLFGQALSAPDFLGPDSAGRYLLQYAPNNFVAAAVPLPVVAYGFWVDATDPVSFVRSLIQCQQFDTPFAFLAVGDTLPVVVQLGLTQC